MSNIKERAAQVAKDEASFNKVLFYIFLMYFFVLSSESLPVTNSQANLSFKLMLKPLII